MLYRTLPLALSLIVAGQFIESTPAISGQVHKKNKVLAILPSTQLIAEEYRGKNYDDLPAEKKEVLDRVRDQCDDETLGEFDGTVYKLSQKKGIKNTVSGYRFQMCVDGKLKQNPAFYKEVITRTPGKQVVTYQEKETWVKVDLIKEEFHKYLMKQRDNLIKRLDNLKATRKSLEPLSEQRNNQGYKEFKRIGEIETVESVGGIPTIQTIDSGVSDFQFYENESPSCNPSKKEHFLHNQPSTSPFLFPNRDQNNGFKIGMQGEETIVFSDNKVITIKNGSIKIAEGSNIGNQTWQKWISKSKAPVNTSPAGFSPLDIPTPSIGKQRVIQSPGFVKPTTPRGTSHQNIGPSYEDNSRSIRDYYFNDNDYYFNDKQETNDYRLDSINRGSYYQKRQQSTPIPDSSFSQKQQNLYDSTGSSYRDYIDRQHLRQQNNRPIINTYPDRFTPQIPKFPGIPGNRFLNFQPQSFGNRTEMLTGYYAPEVLISSLPITSDVGAGYFVRQKIETNPYFGSSPIQIARTPSCQEQSAQLRIKQLEDQLDDVIRDIKHTEKLLRQNQFTIEQNQNDQIITERFIYVRKNVLEKKIKLIPGTEKVQIVFDAQFNFGNSIGHPPVIFHRRPRGDDFQNQIPRS